MRIHRHRRILLEFVVNPISDSDRINRFRCRQFLRGCTGMRQQKVVEADFAIGGWLKERFEKLNNDALEPVPAN